MLKMLASKHEDAATKLICKYASSYSAMNQIIGQPPPPPPYSSKGCSGTQARCVYWTAGFKSCFYQLNSGHGASQTSANVKTVISGAPTLKLSPPPGTRNV